MRVSQHEFQCVTAWSVSVGPEPSSAVKRGSPSSEPPSPAPQPGSRADQTLAVQYHFGSAPCADRLCIGKRKRSLATSPSPWDPLQIPLFRRPRIRAGKRSGITGLSRLAPSRSTIRIETSLRPSICKRTPVVGLSSQTGINRPRRKAALMTRSRPARDACKSQQSEADDHHGPCRRLRHRCGHNVITDRQSGYRVAIPSAASEDVEAAAVKSDIRAILCPG